MRRYFESLRPADRSAIDSVPDGLFLVQVDRVQYHWHTAKPYYQIRFAVLEPKHLAGCLITGRLYCTARAMWKLSWFLRDFGYDSELLGKNEIDDQALIGRQGVLKVSHAIVHGISVLNLDGFAPLSRWQELSLPRSLRAPILSDLRWPEMVYSFTQISQYLTCPRRYRHRYLDGWQEKDTRAAMLFGRAFERALAAFFLRQDAAVALFQEWKLYEDQKLEYSHGDSWHRMLEQGIQLLERFCQEDRVRIRQPRRNLQIKFVRPLSPGSEFVAYIDAIGWLDSQRCLIEWKTASARYPTEPDGLLALDPQLVCYSWITGVSEVAQVVFVRKRQVEVQYLRTTINDQQRREFEQLVETTIRQIESAQFLPHSGIRFPQNPCSSCPYIGLCLGKQELIEAALIRRPGAEQLDWLDELHY